MKKFLMSFVIIAVLVATLAAAGSAFAQSETPPAADVPVYGQGGGSGNRGGARGAQGGNAQGAGLQGTGDGILHDELIAFYAEKLGLTVDELNTRLANGETMADIAFEQGYTAEEFSALMAEAHSLAIDQAVAAGEITPEQAEWMQQRGSRMGGAGRGTGLGRNANPDCPYYGTTATP